MKWSQQHSRKRKHGLLPTSGVCFLSLLSFHLGTRHGAKHCLSLRDVFSFDIECSTQTTPHKADVVQIAVKEDGRYLVLVYQCTATLRESHSLSPSLSLSLLALNSSSLDQWDGFLQALENTGITKVVKSGDGKHLFYSFQGVLR